MFKTKKLLLGIAAVAATSTIAVTAIACSGEINKEVKTLTQITPKADADVKAKIGAKKFAELGKMVLITDNGSIDDQSFNQSTWDAVKYTARQIGIITEEDGAKNIQSLKPAGADAQSYYNQYDIALQAGYKYWILPGFTHQDKIQNYWNNKKAQLEAAGVVVIGVDFNPNSEAEGTKNRVPAKHSVSLDFKTEESGFIVGYGAAKYLGEGSSETKKLYTFGGFKYNAVTDFIRGFLSGIKLYNDGAEKAKRVQMATETIDLASGFKKDSAMDTSVSKAVLSKSDMILPVAGPATEVLVDALGKDKGNKALVIGVDVDQSKPLSTAKDRFFSSIEKRISQAVYESLINLYTGEAVGMPTDAKPIVKRGDFAEAWVGFSASTLPAAEKTKADAALAEGKKFFEDPNNKDAIRTTLKTDAEFNGDTEGAVNALAKAINDKFKEA